MSFLPDYDDAIGRVRFVGVGRAKYRKRVRGEDRQKDHRYHQRTVRFHAQNIPVRPIGFYDASGGFSGTTEAGSATPSSEGSLRVREVKKLPASAAALRRTDHAEFLKERISEPIAIKRRTCQPPLPTWRAPSLPLLAVRAKNSVAAP